MCIAIQESWKCGSWDNNVAKIRNFNIWKPVWMTFGHMFRIKSVGAFMTEGWILE